jgi:DNA modification methylase
LWLLGDHRLLCGDSGDDKDVDRLLAGEAVHLVNTDPPYNVNVQPRTNNAIAAGRSSFGKPKSRYRKNIELRARDRVLVNDCVSDEEFARLLLAWFGTIGRVLDKGRAFYIWGGYANSSKYPAAMAASELRFAQAIIWVKQPVPTRKDFMGAHEWCFYGWRQGAGHEYYGPRNATDVWGVKKVPWQRRIHLTEKPVELARRAIEYSTHPGEHVLDLFAGSGSTLAAAQETGRRAFLMEVDALYCDLIVERWKALTGQHPRLERKRRR